MLLYKGKIEGKLARDMKDGKKYVMLKFIDFKPDDDLNLIEVRVPDDIDHTQFTKGQEVTIALDYHVFNNRVVFRMTRLIPQTATASPGASPSSSPAAPLKRSA